MEIRKAQKKKSKLRLALNGPSGSGKTYSAILMALGMGGKIGLIDTENGSGDLYEHLGDYDIIGLKAPYTIKKYIDAIDKFEEAGYDVIVIDSLTHAWAGEGGLLDKQGKIEESSSSKNGYLAWRKVTPEHNSLVERILTSKSHIIVTMRTKVEYVMEMNEKTKKMTPVKVGMAPIQREGMDYEFTVVLDIDQKTHLATASKDRTESFQDIPEKISKATGKKLIHWLDSGVAELPVEDFPIDEEETQQEDIKQMGRELCKTIKLCNVSVQLEHLMIDSEHMIDKIRKYHPEIIDPIMSMYKKRKAEINKMDLEQQNG